MQDGLRTETTSSSNVHAIELSYIGRINDNHSINSNTYPPDENSNAIKNHLKKFIKKMDCLGVEERGVERVSPADRTDPTIINTAMIWVIY